MKAIPGSPCVLRSPARVALLLCAAAPPVVAGRKAEADLFRLPPAADWQQATRGVFPETARGLPLCLSAVSVVRLGDCDVLLIPVLGETPAAAAASRGNGVGDAAARKVFSRDPGGRSLCSLEPGVTVLHCVLIDVAPLRRQTTGVGLVLVTRVDARHCDVVVESHSGEILAAARGTIPLRHAALGHESLAPGGTPGPNTDALLIPVDEQARVRRRYRPRWNLDPHIHGFPLFACNWQVSRVQ
jgi:hypothetical protein